MPKRHPTLTSPPSPDDIAPEQALAALETFVQAARAAQFGEFPPLPAGFFWSADLSGIFVLADAEQENLFLDVLLQHLEPLAAQGNLAKLNALVSQQLGLLQALVAHYEVLEQYTRNLSFPEFEATETEVVQ